MTLERVGFIGLGAMGAPMAARLVDVADTLTVFDPVAERQQSLADQGAVSAQSPLEAAREADALFVMVVNEAQCEEALFGSDGAVAALPQDAVVVIMSTVGPHAVRALAERLHRRGVQLVDAPVSGGVARPGAGDLLIMASGPAGALDVVRPALTAMGSTVVDCRASAGDGQSVKLVSQLLCGGHIEAAGEALGYARALGLDPAAVHETIRHGAAGSFMLDDRGARMLSREFQPAKSALEIFVKDMGLVTEAAAGRRFPAPLAATANQLFLIGAAQGYSGDDDSGIVRVFEQWADKPDA
jgi:3-hydroxyisobutyrate dehydrogenase-like beta-hydroxyacid dehydrogenase